MPRATDESKVGDLVVLNHYEVGHFGYITKRFKKKVEVETTLMKRRRCKGLVAVHNNDGSPTLDKEGHQIYKKEYEKIPPVRVRFKRYLDEVKKIEVKDNEMPQLLSTGGAQQEAQVGPADASGKSQPNDVGVQASDGCGEQNARGTDELLQPNEYSEGGSQGPHSEGERI